MPTHICAQCIFISLYIYIQIYQPHYTRFVCGMRLLFFFSFLSNVKIFFFFLKKKLDKLVLGTQNCKIVSNFINIFLPGYLPVLSLLNVKLKDIFESNKSLIQKVESSYIYIYIYMPFLSIMQMAILTPQLAAPKTLNTLCYSFSV